MVQSLLVVLAELIRRRPDDLVTCLAGIQLKGRCRERRGVCGMGSTSSPPFLSPKDTPVACIAVNTLHLPPNFPFFLKINQKKSFTFNTPPSPHPRNLNPPHVPPSDGSNALASALDRWSRRQTEVLDDYDMRLTASALGVLLLSGHPALAAITVRGRRLEAQARGVRTRARAAAAPDSWSQVPLKSKLLQLLVKAYSYSTALEVYDFGSSNASEDEDVDGSDDEASASAGHHSYNGGSGGGGGGETIMGCACWIPCGGLHRRPCPALLLLLGQSPRHGGAGSARRRPPKPRPRTPCPAPPATGIQDLLGAGDLEDSDNPLVDPLEAARRKGDALSRLDLPAHLRQVVTQFSALDPEGCHAACRELGDLERQTFQQMVM